MQGWARWLTFEEDMRYFQVEEKVVKIFNGERD